MHLPLIYHPNYSCPFPAEHRFVMSKFVRLHDHLLAQGYIDGNLLLPQRASAADLSICHDPVYLADLLANDVEHRAWRRIGLPWSTALVERTFTAPNGTLLAARTALQSGMACHLAGGTHHAHRDFGSGFCMVNDLAYTSLQLLQHAEVSKILIFDLDVHQGDGTAALLAHEPRAFTCSIHCDKNFPFRKTSSDLDIGLPDGVQDAVYLALVEETLLKLLEQVKPDLVLYDAGVDVWQHDGLGKLNISWQGIERRDELVLRHCLTRHIPIATVIGGGYDTDHARLARRHAIVVQSAWHLFESHLR
jgi:acetoin utilization deacetylase AcuC-like enzyme